MQQTIPFDELSDDEIAPVTLSNLKETDEKKNVSPDNPNFDDDYVAEILANSTLL